MDLNSILDKYICAACIMSVEVFDDGKYGNIRIAAANSAHKELQKRLKGIEYSENIPYEECLPRSLNFEDYCYRSAVLHEPHHSYIEIADFERWLQQQIEQLLLGYYSRQMAQMRARKAIDSMRKQSEMNGNSELTLDEINEEICQARKERKDAVAQ